ncbi:MAG: hypothetical protein ACQERC_12485 [Bacteroidota bacterium]
MKSLMLTVLSVFFLSTHVVWSQSDFEDDQVAITTSTKSFEDAKNDRFYEYHAFSVTNKTNAPVKFELIISYAQDGKEQSSRDGDKKRIIRLDANETIEGEVGVNDELTLFKAFLPGNSGKKAAESEVKVNNINVNYL